MIRHKIVLLDDITNYCDHPSTHEMLKYDLWELNEAIFIITQWPEFIVKSSYENIARHHNISRTFLYEPAPPRGHHSPLEWEFNRLEMGFQVENTYIAMRQAVLSGELPLEKVVDLGSHVYGKYDLKKNSSLLEGEFVSILLSPQEAVIWALKKGIPISSDLQKALNISIVPEKCDKDIRRKVEIKITGQFLKKIHRGKSDTFYCRHEWMKGYVSTTPGVKDKYGSIRKLLRQLGDPSQKRERGNKTKECRENEKFFPSAIKEVVITEGTNRYNIPMLIIAMKTAANLLLRRFIENHSLPQCVEIFMSEFMSHEIVSLYTTNAPRLIINIIYSTAYHTVESLFNRMNAWKT